uniref:AMP-binding enzyme C-terminal domain-containing protein n=1 Tax=Candidatus Kentrum sp. FW TaxID=2126338 RepID=A0A450S7R4_9GAMM|nr:MAG: AMP-binding enzyme C-terminal domain-containing protein [Candidatus Kentron sp. FW]
MTPVYVHQFLSAATEHWEELGACGFRLLNSGGEALPSATVGLWRETAGGVGKFLNTYGPTEATVTAARGGGGRPRGGDKQLVAWVVGTDDTVGATDVGATGRSPVRGGWSPVRGGRSPVRDELRAHPRGMLPDWMMPSVFVFLDALPLTPSGKIDRRALPDPGREDLIKKEYVAPFGSDEETIAGIWAELLGVEQVGVLDNFFDLGGHSLLIVQAHARLREHFTPTPSMTDLFQYPTVQALARFLGERNGDTEEEPSEAFRKSVRNRASRRRAALGRGLISE